MSIIGKTLAHYEIASQIGKGGMGEVYKAKDKKLGREVAIKVLPEEFARDADRVARFQREAKLLASLNHPNIGSIYGLEESNGTHFLVLELVEGETLADQIKRGPISVEESLKLALQIAEALEAAHEKGIIHRDLKPANIKITDEGKVKVLDFGLAKAFAGSQEDINLSNSPTLSDAATQKGVILGTAAYMSPEQAKGKTVDKHADIWAFGVVFFEMLTGRQVFTGETVSDTLASVLAREPEWQRLPPNLHPRIRFLLERGLEKEPKNRYSGISDARVDIQKVLTYPGGVFGQPATSAEPPTRLRTMLPWLAATLVLTAIIVGVVVWSVRAPEARRVMRFGYTLPEDQQFFDIINPILAASPDGSQFVYSTNEGLYLQSVDELEARLIGDTKDGPVQPFFSPDGQWIGYHSVADIQIKKIAISGGAPVSLADGTSPQGSSWGADNTIIYVGSEGIMRISANGGIPELLISSEDKMVFAPQMLPDRKSLLFTSGIPGPYKIEVQSLKSGERKELFEGDGAKYISTGHLVYALGNNIFAIPFDIGTLEVVGGSVPLIENVFRPSPLAAALWDVSDSGTLVYAPMGELSQQSLVWVDRKGIEEPLTAAPNNYGDVFRVSPDGTRVALTIAMGTNQDIWIWDLIRETMTRLTFDEAGDAIPLWTPDSQRIVFVSGRDGVSGGIYWKAADGTGEVEHLCSEPGFSFLPWSWSGDGSTLIFVEQKASPSIWDIGMLSMEGDRVRSPLLHGKHNESGPQISPNGRWMAYQSNESGRWEIYVRPFPEVNKGKWQVSTSGGTAALWSPDGRELFYSSPEGIMAVTVDTERAFKLETPKTIFTGQHLEAWDISPDGKRFLMLKPIAAMDDESTARGPHKINIVLNWFEELNERVPTK
jgi:serine/threonine protein kinase/Tol biopolymer transport system component